VTEKNALLQAYTPWLHRVANGMTQGHIHDDLVQEGYIAMWRALGTYVAEKGSIDWWLKNAAINRMKSVISGGTMTTTTERKDSTGFTTGKGDATRQKIESYISAHPKAKGAEIAAACGISESSLSYQRKKMGVVATSQALSGVSVSVDAMTDAGWDLEGPTHLEGVDVAYHAGEICQALDVLTDAQKKYVVARFWGSKSPAELKALFGYDPSSLWRDAKPRLVARLEYLRELAEV
jgi:RNA polymerase sigma factor (sigma-70 family)